MTACTPGPLLQNKLWDVQPRRFRARVHVVEILTDKLLGTCEPNRMWLGSSNQDLEWIQRLYQLSKKDTIILRIVRSEERRLYSKWKIQSKQYLTVKCTPSQLYEVLYSIRVQWPRAVDMQYKIMKKPSSPQEFKCCWSVQMKSDVACLETYKNIKTIQWSETRISLIYVDF